MISLSSLVAMPFLLISMHGFERFAVMCVVIFLHTCFVFYRRILAGLDLHTPQFAILPPYFKEEADHIDIQEVLQICFGSMLGLYQETKGGLEGVLVMLLVFVVFHINSFVSPMIHDHPGHLFSLLPLFQTPDLLNQFQLIVTIDPTRKAAMMPTGIPPHIDHSIHLQNVVVHVNETLHSMKL